jgi:hypothetical protein
VTKRWLLSVLGFCLGGTLAQRVSPEFRLSRLRPADPYIAPISRAGATLRFVVLRPAVTEADSQLRCV